jgi:hypothetical protein
MYQTSRYRESKVDGVIAFLEYFSGRGRLVKMLYWLSIPTGM